MNYQEPRYPGETNVPRLTQSAVETFLRCGLRRFKEIETPNRRITVRMAIGTGVAKGAERDICSKITTGRHLSITSIVDAAVAGYAAERDGCDVVGSRREIGEGEDHTAQAARVYGFRVSPVITAPLAAEEAIVARIGGELELAGTPDVVTPEGIGDLKTGQPWTQARADSCRQLSAYGILHKAKWGTYPRRCWIDSLGRTSRGWTFQRLWTYRNENDYAGYWQILQRVSAAIQAGVFLPAPEGAWWCSPRWCPYWCGCEAVSKQRRTNDE